MNISSMDTIKNIALQVRRWAERRAEQGGDNPDLCGYCAIASAKLFNRLIEAGFKPELRLHESENLGHVFVAVEDNVIDLTASQFVDFHYEDMVIMHEREAEAYFFYKPAHVFNSVKALIRYQKQNGWPAYQTAFKD